MSNADQTQRRQAGEWLAVAYDEHAPALARYLSARVGPGLAEDLLSDVFLLALRRQHTFDRALGTPVAWLFGIATNILRQHRRREVRHFEFLATMHGQTAGSGDETSEQAINAVDAAALARGLIPTLRGLDPVDRDILLLTSWAGLTPVDIAAALGIPAGTVRSRLYRLRHRLRAALPPPVVPALKGSRDHVSN